MKNKILLASLLVSEMAMAEGDPLDGNVFPSSDWAGPSPSLGVLPDNDKGLLQKALFGDSLDKWHLKVSGYIDAGANISSSSQSNAPMSYNVVPNSIQLNQAVLTVEKQLNTADKTHTDWGFKFTSLYGMDYRYTTAQGYFSGQLLQNNNLYGYDPLEMFGVYYIPGVVEGMTIKAGRYISPPDIEAQLAIQNYLYSHSLMFTVDAYTYTGVLTNTKLNDNWQVSIGIHGANDMAPWEGGNQTNGQFLVRWDSNTKNDSLWGGLNSIGANNAINGHDNLGASVLTWGHKFNDIFHMQTEGYYQWEYNGNLGGSCNYGPVYTYGGGGGCGPVIMGYSWSAGLVNYFEMKLNSKDYLTLRNDYLDDPQGQRTGYATQYTSQTFGYSHRFTNYLQIRPEIRYEEAFGTGATPYNNGTAPNQATFSVDLIFRF